MAMGEILDKIKRGDFLVDEWCNIHSKYEMLSLKEKLYAEAMTMGMERGKIVHTGSNEIKTKGIGGLTEQEQREQKNMFEILSRLDNWLFFDGSNNDLQRFIIALNKIGYRLNEAQLYLGRNYEEHIKQVVGLVSILENLNEDALYNQEDIKKECELNRIGFEKRIKPLLDKDIKELEESISSFRKVWFEDVDNLGDQGYWTDEQRRDYKSWFSHLDYLFIARLKQFQKVFRKPFEMQKKELNELNEHYYKIVVEVVNTRLVKGDSSVCIDEICSLIERQLNESFTLDVENYIDYVKECLKDGKYLNIYGRGNPILEDGLPIALTELKHKLSKKESIKGKEETSTQKTNQNKKGRQTKSIQECISKKEDIERVLKLLHDYIDGKNGSAICLPLLAVIRLGKMTKPTHTQIINEFGEVITKSLYNAYMKEYKFNQVELDGVTREIAQDLG